MINIGMKVLSIIALVLMLSGCGTLTVNKSKFRLDTETLPPITNDKNFEPEKKSTSFILLRGGIFYHYIVRF